ncbi:MAG: hypothetical protein F6K56_00120 [Moorea sp. SIO3G5]|nr:hypothetical protein [Moorena sp. SIO3G5]
METRLLAEVGNREQGTGNREQGTGNREQGTGNREQGTESQLSAISYQLSATSCPVRGRESSDKNYHDNDTGFLLLHTLTAPGLPTPTTLNPTPYSLLPAPYSLKFTSPN